MRARLKPIFFSFCLPYFPTLTPFSLSLTKNHTRMDSINWAKMHQFYVTLILLWQLPSTQGLSRDIWGIPDDRELETISQPSFLLPTSSMPLIPSSFLPCSSHLTLQRIGRSRIIFIKIQTPVFYKYLLWIAFFYCELH